MLEVIRITQLTNHFVVNWWSNVDWNAFALQNATMFTRSDEIVFNGKIQNYVTFQVIAMLWWQKFDSSTAPYGKKINFLVINIVIKNQRWIKNSDKERKRERSKGFLTYRLCDWPFSLCGVMFASVIRVRVQTNDEHNFNYETRKSVVIFYDSSNSYLLQCT